MPEKLTLSYVDKLKPKDRRYDIRDVGLQGLFVRVEPTGKKTYYLDYSNANSKRKTSKIGSASVLSPAQAREAGQVILASIAIYGIDPNERPLEAPALKQTLDEYEAAGGSGYIAMMVKTAFDWLMDKPISDIAELDIERWRSAQRRIPRKCKKGERGKPTKPITYATLNKKTSSLKTLLNWAVQKGKMIQVNPLATLKKLKETDSKEKLRYLTDEERSRLLDALSQKRFDNYFRPFMIMALYTGIRRGALFALEWEDVDFESKTILLRSTNAKSGKTSVLPINNIVVRALEEWREKAPNTTGLIFTSPKTGRKMNNCDRAFSNLLHMAGIKDFTFHGVRHDFASRLARKVNLYVVKELLTHSDIKMTQRYSHLADNDIRQAVDLLVPDNRIEEGDL